MKVFVAVAENLSFTRAAESLYLTQSAVSHQIAKLEQQLGVALLLRQGRAVSLTAVGQSLLTHARRVFAALEDAAAAVRQAARPDAGRLRIGATSTACQYLIPEALREFRECFPGYSLSILPGDSPVVAERLTEGSIDLAVMIRHERRSRMVYHHLFTDELGMLVSPLHPWAKSGKVDRQQLGEQRLVHYSRNSATFRLVDRYFARMRAPLHDPIELGSMEAIKELVKLGLGVSVVARWIARSEIAERSLVWLPLPGGRLKRSWCIATPSGKKLSVAEQTFIGLCQDAAGALR
ncbi:MAG TPA: LysR family transcriptional regulator [Tepidisphaeraceae bacterium]|nr:LysR family transcriptional regulator [Tepidisphaeraceae bacterium]